MKEKSLRAGRFAPSPTGRMHLGNIFTALLSWLDSRRAGVPWVLRIEDLDPQRSRREYAERICDDLAWLGLDWDEGGVEERGPHGPYFQSRRSDFYREVLKRLEEAGAVYPCYCTKADILATQAPHASDGLTIYPGTCRPAHGKPVQTFGRKPSVRLIVPDEQIVFTDRIFGFRSVNLARDCGDFVLRRADGAWAYQLAVVADDAAMGIGRIVRGCDLLDSSARQIYLCRLLGYEVPEYIHVPLICNREGIRLSKRDSSLAMDSLRQRYSPREIVGWLAHLAGQLPEPQPCTPSELIELFDLAKIPSTTCLIV